MNSGPNSKDNNEREEKPSTVGENFLVFFFDQAYEIFIKFLNPSNNYDILSRVVLVASIVDIFGNFFGPDRSLKENTIVAVSCCYLFLAILSLRFEEAIEPTNEPINETKIHWLYFTAIINVFAINYFVQFYFWKQ